MAIIGIMAMGRIELGPTGAAVAANVKRLRAAQGMSLRALSVELERRGRKLNVDAINKIENGADPDTTKGIRRVDADDLVALAAALGVSPATLLLPHDARGTTEVTGVGEVDTGLAWQWLWCNDPIELPDDEATADRVVTQFLLDARPIGLFAPQRDDRIPGRIREPRGDG